MKEEIWIEARLTWEHIDHSFPIEMEIWEQSNAAEKLDIVKYAFGELLGEESFESIEKANVEYYE